MKLLFLNKIFSLDLLLQQDWERRYNETNGLIFTDRCSIAKTRQFIILALAKVLLPI